MSAINGNVFAVGARYMSVFALNSAGVPAATTSTDAGYEGVEVKSIKHFNLTIPPPRKFTHVGNDAPLAIDFLPPLEAMSGDIGVSAEDQDLQALVTGVKSVSLGEAKELAIATSKQGYEQMLGFMIYQQAEDVSTGLRRWRSIISPAARFIYMPSGMSDALQDVNYQIAPVISTKHLWGATYTIAIDGCIHAQLEQIFTTGKPALITWVGDTSSTVFTWDTAKVAINPTTAISAWKTSAGVTTKLAYTTDFTATTGAITVSGTPLSATEYLTVFLEYL